MFAKRRKVVIGLSNESELQESPAIARREIRQCAFGNTTYFIGAAIILGMLALFSVSNQWVTNLSLWTVVGIFAVGIMLTLAGYLMVPLRYRGGKP